MTWRGAPRRPPARREPSPAADLVMRVERVAAGGDGIAHHPDGRVAFVRGGLPNELVRVHINEQRKDYVKGTVTEVVEPSPARREPPCAQVAAGCGGCGWQHITLDAQREMKREIVIDALRRLGGLTDPAVRLGSPLGDLGWRTTVRFSVDRHGVLGFRAARSHRTVTTERCLVAHPLIDELLPGLRLPGAEELTIRVGARTGQRAAWWNPDGLRPTMLPDDVATGPDAAITEVIHGTRLRVSAGSFFQSSPEAAEMLCDEVRAAAGDLLTAGGGAIVDAYGGIGLFTAVTVPADRRAIVVEVSASSIADAVHHLAGRDVAIVNSTVEQWTPLAADLVIADPARSGLGAVAAERLTVGTNCDRLVLISCDAAAAGRDARLLAGHGYRHNGSVVLDPFPHTPHVEIVSRFDSARK
jgi:23S rRNA (uracil1939-C5)-methyltransferase